MLSRGDRVVVGLSGGPDSVTLLHILKEYQEPMEITLFAAHVNHCLRGGASDEDAAFAERLCREWNIPFFQKKADIGALSAKSHRSEEETGRLVRYDFFRQVLRQVNGDRIATAHHRDDQAETILHHIIRGAGMQGLCGIAPVSQGVLIRPLLDVTREEIRDYLRENKQTALPGGRHQCAFLPYQKPDPERTDSVSGAGLQSGHCRQPGPDGRDCPGGKRFYGGILRQGVPGVLFPGAGNCGSGP